MKIIDVIKSFTIDEMVDFLDEHTTMGGTPWEEWFDENYCSKCMPEVSPESYYCGFVDCAYCELHNKCKYFLDMDDVPDYKQVIKMWLETEDYQGVIK